MAEAKIYCGDRSDLPGNQNYTRFGTRNECLKCGFGAAMYKYRWAAPDNIPRPPLRARQGCLRSERHDRGDVRGNQFIGGRRDPGRPYLRERTKLIVTISVWLLICIATFVLLYMISPDPVTKIENKKKVIKWDTFIIIYSLIVMSITSLFVFFYSMVRIHDV